MGRQSSTENTMKDKKFNPGDVVIPKTLGPLKTSLHVRIRRVLSDGPAICVYRLPYTVTSPDLSPFFDLRDVSNGDSFETWCGCTRIKDPEDGQPTFVGIDAALAGNYWICTACAEAIRLALAAQIRMPDTTAP